MRAPLCAAALFLCVAPVFPGTSTTPFPVTIVYQFNGPATEFVLQEMKEEIQQVLATSSLPVNWRNRSEVAGSDSMRHLVVVDFQGHCRTEAGGATPHEGQPLGRARVVNGEVLPFIEIDCGSVQSFLHSVLASRPGQNTDLTLGRALARVLAHELYHVLAGTTTHSRSGIAQPSLSADDLASSHLNFAPADVDRMKFPRDQTLEVRVARRGAAFIQ